MRSLIVAITTLVGCGDGATIEESRTRLEGTVLLDGQPLPGGSVTLVSASDTRFRATSMIQADGSFGFADAPLGPVKVSVETASLRFGAPPETYVPIPANYANVETSGLTDEILKDAEPLKISLKR